MNIFAVDYDPIIAGSVLPDKLTVKMVLEVAQMLSTAVRVHGYDGNDIYKQAHLNHPCSLWARTNQSNFEWLVMHGLAIAEEYTVRYGKVHKSQAIIERCAELIDLLPVGNQTNFPQCMPDQYKHATDPTIAYRNYIQNKPYWQDRPYRKGRDFTDFYTNLTTTVPAGK